MVIGNKEITKKLIYRIAVMLVLATLIVGVLVYFGLIWREKKQFALAEKEIDALYAQIVEKIGKPDQEKKTKSCGYASRVYGKGPRGCSVTQRLLYESSGLGESNKIMVDVLKLSNGTYLQTFGDKSKNRFTDQENRTDQHISQDYRDIGDLSCGISYYFPVVKEFSDDFEPRALENLQIEISCGGPALAEYFPIKN